MKIFITFLLFSSAFAADIAGLWQASDRNSKKPQCIVLIYKHDDKYYGRMLATYDEHGKIKDTIYEQKEKAPGVVGNPPYCGLDFIYNLEQEGDEARYKGIIIDPEKGKAYDVEVWSDNGKTIQVRGEIWIFGQTQNWPKATKRDLPNFFKVPNPDKLTPVIPEVTN